MLYLAAYSFLLRVPSEALPMERVASGVSVSIVPGQGGKSVISCDSEEVVLRLLARKNVQGEAYTGTHRGAFGLRVGVGRHRFL